MHNTRPTRRPHITLRGARSLRAAAMQRRATSSGFPPTGSTRHEGRLTYFRRGPHPTPKMRRMRPRTTSCRHTAARRDIHRRSAETSTAAAPRGGRFRPTARGARETDRTCGRWGRCGRCGRAGACCRATRARGTVTPGWWKVLSQAGAVPLRGVPSTRVRASPTPLP